MKVNDMTENEMFIIKSKYYNHFNIYNVKNLKVPIKIEGLPYRTQNPSIRSLLGNNGTNLKVYPAAEKSLNINTNIYSDTMNIIAFLLCKNYSFKGIR